LSEPDSASTNPRTADSRERDTFYLAHMLECIESIERYTAAHDIELDELTHDAVLRKLQILAESFNRVPDACKTEFPEVRCPVSAAMFRYSKLRFPLFCRPSRNSSPLPESADRAALDFGSGHDLALQ
jgi:hypothetical protein